MKRLTGLILACLLIICTFSVNVFAEDIKISDIDELKGILSDGGTAVLEADIGLNDYVTLESDAILDLNGHKITVTEEEMSGSIVIPEGKTLTVSDSKGGGGITAGNWIEVVVEKGKLVLESGYIQNIAVSGGIFEMQGGESKQVQFNDNNGLPVIKKGDSAKVEEWVCGIGTVNFDPTEYLSVGFVVVIISPYPATSCGAVATIP